MRKRSQRVASKSPKNRALHSAINKMDTPGSKRHSKREFPLKSSLRKLLNSTRKFNTKKSNKGNLCQFRGSDSGKNSRVGPQGSQMTQIQAQKALLSEKKANFFNTLNDNSGTKNQVSEAEGGSCGPGGAIPSSNPRKNQIRRSGISYVGQVKQAKNTAKRVKKSHKESTGGSGGGIRGYQVLKTGSRSGIQPQNSETKNFGMMVRRPTGYEKTSHRRTTGYHRPRNVKKPRNLSGNRCPSSQDRFEKMKENFPVRQLRGGKKGSPMTKKGVFQPRNSKRDHLSSNRKRDPQSQKKAKNEVDGSSEAETWQEGASDSQTSLKKETSSPSFDSKIRRSNGLTGLSRTLKRASFRKSRSKDNRSEVNDSQPFRKIKKKLQKMKESKATKKSLSCRTKTIDSLNYSERVTKKQPKPRKKENSTEKTQKMIKVKKRRLVYSFANSRDKRKRSGLQNPTIGSIERCSSNKILHTKKSSLRDVGARQGSNGARRGSRVKLYRLKPLKTGSSKKIKLKSGHHSKSSLRRKKHSLKQSYGRMSHKRGDSMYEIGSLKSWTRELNSTSNGPENEPSGTSQDKKSSQKAAERPERAERGLKSAFRSFRGNKRNSRFSGLQTASKQAKRIRNGSHSSSVRRSHVSYRKKSRSRPKKDKMEQLTNLTTIGSYERSNQFNSSFKSSITPKTIKKVLFSSAKSKKSANRLKKRKNIFRENSGLNHAGYKKLSTIAERTGSIPSVSLSKMQKSKKLKKKTFDSLKISTGLGGAREEPRDSSKLDSESGGVENGDFSDQKNSDFEIKFEHLKQPEMLTYSEFGNENPHSGLIQFVKSEIYEKKSRSGSPKKQEKKPRIRIENYATLPRNTSEIQSSHEEPTIDFRELDLVDLDLSAPYTSTQLSGLNYNQNIANLVQNEQLWGLNHYGRMKKLNYYMRDLKEYLTFSDQESAQKDINGASGGRRGPNMPKIFDKKESLDQKDEAEYFRRVYLSHFLQSYQTIQQHRAPGGGQGEPGWRVSGGAERGEGGGRGSVRDQDGGLVCEGIELGINLTSYDVKYLPNRK